MKKSHKKTPGQKKEAQLAFRYRELKRAGKLRKEDGSHMNLKEFRNSEFNTRITKKIQIKTKKGKVFERIVVKFVEIWKFLEAKGEKKPKSPMKPLSERREERRKVKSWILQQIQLAAIKRKEKKEARREARKTLAIEKRNKVELREVA